MVETVGHISSLIIIFTVEGMFVFLWFSEGDWRGMFQTCSLTFPEFPSWFCAAFCVCFTTWHNLNGWWQFSRYFQNFQSTKKKRGTGSFSVPLTVFQQHVPLPALPTLCAANGKKLFFLRTTRWKKKNFSEKLYSKLINIRRRRAKLDHFPIRDNRTIARRSPARAEQG